MCIDEVDENESVDDSDDDVKLSDDNDESDGFVDELVYDASDTFDDEEPNNDDEALCIWESLAELSCNRSGIPDDTLVAKLELSNVVSISLNSRRVNQRSEESSRIISSYGGLGKTSSRTGSFSFIL